MAAGTANGKRTHAAPTTTSVPDNVWRRLRTLRSKRETAKNRISDLARERKALDEEIMQTGEQEIKKKADLKQRWYDVVHSLDAHRSAMNSLADQIDATIRDADQGKFEWDEEDAITLPDLPTLFSKQADAEKGAGEQPIENLAAGEKAVAERVVAMFRRAGMRTVGSVADADLKSLGGLTPGDIKDIEAKLDLIGKEAKAKKAAKS